MEFQLSSFFEEDNHRHIGKWSHYLEVYERYFYSYRNKKTNFLEIGIQHGGSIQMWDHYFQSMNYYGIDIVEETKKFEKEHENVQIFIGDQGSIEFLKKVAKELPDLDLIVDDGGHEMHQQIRSFQTFFPKLKDGGIYICEDTHTSYWSRFQGGVHKKGTFIKFCFSLVDKLHAFHSEERNFEVDYFSQNIKSIHFYDSMVVFEKGKVDPPFMISAGTPSIQTMSNRISPVKKIKYRLHRIMHGKKIK